MGKRRKFSAEFKREAVVLTSAPDVSVAASWGLERTYWAGGVGNCTPMGRRHFGSRSGSG